MLLDVRAHREIRSVSESRNSAVAIGAQQSHAVLLVALDHAFRRVPERVRFTHRHDCHVRRYGGKELRRRRSFAAVVRRLQEIRRDRRMFLDEFFLGALLDISREQEPYLAIRKPQYKRRVVRR